MCACMCTQLCVFVCVCVCVSACARACARVLLCVYVCVPVTLRVRALATYFDAPTWFGQRTVVCLLTWLFWGWSEPDIYTVYSRYFVQGFYLVYGHIRRINTVPANPGLFVRQKHRYAAERQARGLQGFTLATCRVPRASALTLHGAIFCILVGSMSQQEMF